MIVSTVNGLSYRGLGLNVGSSGSRSYREEYLSLIYGVVMSERCLGYSVCHVCITIDGGTPTNYYTRLFKGVFNGCVYILKREDSGGSFNDNAMGVADSKGEHLHLFVFFPGDGPISVASFSKRLKDLISKVNKNKYRPKRIRNFNIVDSRVKDWVDPDYLEKYDVWFDSLQERREFGGSKREIVLKPSNQEKVFRWVSYLAKNETATNKTQKALFVRDLTVS